MLPKRRQPTHPGRILFEDFLKPLELTSKQFAAKLGDNWNEKKVDAVIRGEEHISDKMAQEIAAVLNTTPGLWMRLQHLYSEWENIHKHNEKGSLKPWKKAQ